MQTETPPLTIRSGHLIREAQGATGEAHGFDRDIEVEQLEDGLDHGEPFVVEASTMNPSKSLNNAQLERVSKLAVF